MTGSVWRGVWRLAIVIAALALPAIASADSRTDLMIARVKYPPDPGVSDDFRVRTNAALGLGATNDDAAVVPLCRALNDPSDVVRQAAAIALKRLGRSSSLNCLKGRLSTEDSSAVKLQLTRAISDLESGGGSSGGAAIPDTFTPKQIASARFYVSTSSITNNTSRTQGDIDRVVLGSIRRKLEGMGKYQIAPTAEASDAAKAVIGKRKLKGYYLALSVDKFDYKDGNLRVKVRCSVFTYPGKSLLGEVPSGLTQSGVTEPDKAAEENLLAMAAERAVDLFEQNFN